VSASGPEPAVASHVVDPLPAEARAFQGRRAGAVTRTLANLVDAAVAAAAVAGGYLTWCALRFLRNPAGFTFPAPRLSVLLICAGVAMFVWFAVCWATTGRTYGDHLMGLRVVDRRGRRPRWGLAIVRAGCCVVLPIGLYWVLVSRSNRSAQDVLLRTSVLYDWSRAAPRPPRQRSPYRERA
jgi:uncharacterized RDD family membrane protein YckC